MGKIVGIDLGTTYSVIAYMNKYGKAEIIHNREGDRITPSVVLFDGEMPLVGSIAKRSASATPLNVIQFVKRQMGDPKVKYRTENGETYIPEEVSAIILKRLKEDAENYLDEPVTDAVITVPAYFNDAQRKATKDAGQIAGLNVLRIINEPTAAALAYGTEKCEKAERVMVYDLGGGTFDITIMDVDTDGISVLATGGDKNLGGFDWDNKLMEYINEEFMKKEGGFDLFDDPVTLQDLRAMSEITKKTLSSRETTKMFVSAGGVNVSIQVTRETFEELTEFLCKRMVSIMRFVLEDAKLQWKNIDKVIPVGGSTRMKRIAALLEELTGKTPSAEIHPDEAVALGAAIQGSLLERDSSSTALNQATAFPLVKVQDVNSHSLGVICIDSATDQEVNDIVLLKNTETPAQASGNYMTMHDNQTEIDVRITEGEDTDIAYVDIIGTTTLKFPSYPKGAPLEAIFRYDQDGMVHVDLIDLTTNKSLKEMSIDRYANLNKTEVDEKRLRICKLEIN